MLGEAQFLGKQFEGRPGAGGDAAGASDMFLRRGEGPQVALAGNEHILGLVPAGDAEQFAAQQVDALAVLCRQRDRYPAGFVVSLGHAAGEVDLVIDGNARQPHGQAGEDGAVGFADAGAGVNQK